jgi:hypothetical protein
MKLLFDQIFRRDYPGCWPIFSLTARMFEKLA